MFIYLTARLMSFVPAPWPVWIWYEYAKSPDQYIQLNLKALRRHAPTSHFKIIFVNRSNIASYVPDLPDAFWRLPTPVAFSDAGRLGLLATHGGLYLDADFLVLRSLVPVAELLQRVDVVGYPFSPPHGNAESAAKCATTGRLSANFLAARPNSSLFRRSWDALREKLPRKCSAGRKSLIYICCRDASTNKPLESCHVPHATTDLMMSRVRHQIWPHSTLSNGSAPISTVYCYGDREDLTTPRLIPAAGAGKQQLQTVLGVPLKVLRLCYGKWRLLGRSLGCQQCMDDRYTVCCRRESDDLVCKSNVPGRGEGRAAGFYARSRLAYHLFDSFQRHAFQSRDHIEWSNLTAAPLYRRALGLSNE